MTNCPLPANASIWRVRSAARSPALTTSASSARFGSAWRQRFEHQAGIAQNACENVVEVVCDAPGQDAETLQLGGLQQIFFGCVCARVISVNVTTMPSVSPIAPDRMRRILDREARSVGAEQRFIAAAPRFARPDDGAHRTLLAADTANRRAGCDEWRRAGRGPASPRASTAASPAPRD